MIFVLRPVLVKSLRLVICTAAGVVLILILVQFFWARFPCYEMEDDYGAPLEYWIALGSVANGSYGENEPFAIECLGTLGKDAKHNVAREYMAAHREETWSLFGILGCWFYFGAFWYYADTEKR